MRVSVSHTKEGYETEAIMSSDDDDDTSQTNTTQTKSEDSGHDSESGRAVRSTDRCVIVPLH